MFCCDVEQVFASFISSLIHCSHSIHWLVSVVKGDAFIVNRFELALQQCFIHFKFQKITDIPTTDVSSNGFEQVFAGAETDIPFRSTRSAGHSLNWGGSSGTTASTWPPGRSADHATPTVENKEIWFLFLISVLLLNVCLFCNSQPRAFKMKAKAQETTKKQQGYNKIINVNRLNAKYASIQKHGRCYFFIAILKNKLSLSNLENLCKNISCHNEKHLGGGILPILRVKSWWLTVEGRKRRSILLSWRCGC